MELYVHERLLARTAVSRYSGRLPLKGGMLLAALGIRSVTRDADLLARALDNDPATVEAVVAELPARLGKARLQAKLDVNFGDPIVGAPTTIPGLLAKDLPSAAPFSLNTYEIEDVLAEKICSMVERGDTNTRERDFGDVWLIGNLMEASGDRLVTALQATAAHRGHDLRPFTQQLQTLPIARQAAWDRYRERLGNPVLPESYIEVVAYVQEFADPAIAGLVAGAV